jgi:hypothetical protein
MRRSSGVVTGSRKNDHPRWGCPRNFSRGTCANSLRERNDAVEAQLITGLQKAVLDPVAVEYAIEKSGVELEKSLAAMTDSIETKRRRQDEIDLELSRLAEAVATQGASPAFLNAIGTRETERKAIEEAVWSSGRDSVQATLSELRTVAMDQLKDIRTVLRGQVQAARLELSKHVDQIVLRPVTAGGQQHYTAEGDWNLFGKYEGRPGAALRNLEMVAGVRFELTTFGL